MPPGEPGIIIDTRPSPGNMDLRKFFMSLINDVVYMSRAMGYVVPTHKDFSGLFNKMHDISGFNVGLLNFIS